MIEQPKDTIFERLFSNNTEFAPEDVQKVSYTYRPGMDSEPYSGILEYVVTLADGSTQTFKISETSLLNDAEIRIENAGCRGEGCIALLSRAEYQGAVGVASGENRTTARTSTYTRESWWTRFTKAMGELNPLTKDAEEPAETYTNFGEV